MRRSEADEWSLVLASQGIPSRIRSLERGFTLHVRDSDRERAEWALGTWQTENPPRPRPAEPPLATGPWTWRVSLAVSTSLLVAFRVLTGRGPESAFARGAADADRILSGETWRSVTALTLHADLAHVLSNALSSAFFLAALGRVVGPGLALCLTVLCGTAGNLANALLHGGDHISVGASTAIFACVGALAGHSVARRERRGSRGRRAWAPVAAGLALIAMLGTGERADLGAHIWGFVCGGVVGVPLGRALRRPPGPIAQWCFALAALLLLAGAWSLALEPGLAGQLAPADLVSGAAGE